MQWISAALEVADTENMADDTVIPTWPADVAATVQYPKITVGALREFQAINKCAEQGGADYWAAIAWGALRDIAAVTELLGVPEEDAGRPLAELVQEYLAANEIVRLQTRLNEATALLREHFDEWEADSGAWDEFAWHDRVAGVLASHTESGTASGGEK